MGIVQHDFALARVVHVGQQEPELAFAQMGHGVVQAGLADAVAEQGQVERGLGVAGDHARGGFELDEATARGFAKPPTAELA